MRHGLFLAGVVGALAALSTMAHASPPPTHLPDQTMIGLKISSIYIFPFHAGVNCDVADTAHLGAAATLVLDYYYPAGTPAPFAHLTHAVTVPATGSVQCGFGHLPNTAYHIDHIKLTVFRGRRRVSHTFPIGW